MHMCIIDTFYCDKRTALISLFNPLTAKFLRWFTISTLPDSVGYLCPRISPAATKPTTILGHGQFNLVNHLWLCKTTPTQGHRPLILAEPPNLMGFTRFAITACSHKLHSWGAAVCGYWPSPKVTNWCSLHPCRSHTSTTMKVRSYAPSNPATRRDTPHVHVLAQEARRKTMDFFPQNLLYLSGDFHTLDRFLRELSFFKWVESFMIHKCIIST